MVSKKRKDHISNIKSVASGRKKAGCMGSHDDEFHKIINSSI